MVFIVAKRERSETSGRVQTVIKGRLNMTCREVSGRRETEGKRETKKGKPRDS